jgi:hypothetical protein
MIEVPQLAGDDGAVAAGTDRLAGGDAAGDTGSQGLVRGAVAAAGPILPKLPLLEARAVNAAVGTVRAPAPHTHRLEATTAYHKAKPSHSGLLSLAGTSRPGGRNEAVRLLEAAHCFGHGSRTTNPRGARNPEDAPADLDRHRL